MTKSVRKLTLGALGSVAAMMAGVVSQLWDFDRLYDEVLMYG